jgi:hypothetical protein
MLRSVCLSVSPHASTRFPLDGFSWNLILGTWKPVEKFQIWLKSDKMSGTLHENINNLYKNTNHQQMHKESFIICHNTLLNVSTLLGHLQGELFRCRYTKVAFYSWVRMCCWLCTALFLNSLRRPGLQRVHASSTQSTAHSHSTIKCNLTVTITKKLSLKMTQQGRNM